MRLLPDDNAPPLSVLLCTYPHADTIIEGLRDHGIAVRHLPTSVSVRTTLRQAPDQPSAIDAVVVDADREAPDDALSISHHVREALPATTPILLLTTATLADLFTAALPLMLPNVSLHCWPSTPRRLAMMLRGAVAAAEVADHPWTTHVFD